MRMAASRSSMPDVNVQAEDEVGARDELEVLDHLVIARIGIDFLGTPVGERVRGAGDELEFVFARELDHFATKLVDVFAGFVDVAADASADLDDGGVHLGLDALLKAHLALRKHLGLDVGAQVARDRVDGLVFLFNAEREGWPHGMTSGQLGAIVLQGIRNGRTRDWGPGCMAQAWSGGKA